VYQASAWTADKKVKEVEPEVTEEGTFYKHGDSLKDRGWKSKGRTEYGFNKESKEYIDRNLPLDDTNVKASPARKHTNLEKAMGIVEDDRPKEKTAYGIKTY
jgi:hypothetical protein